MPQDVLGEDGELDREDLLPGLEALEGLEELLQVRLPPLPDVGDLLGVDPHVLDDGGGVSLNQLDCLHLLRGEQAQNIFEGCIPHLYIHEYCDFHSGYKIHAWPRGRRRSFSFILYMIGKNWAQSRM